MKHSIATSIHRGELPQGYEIQPSDVGRGLGLPAEGFGIVLTNDIGKRVFCKGYVTTMENDAQRDERLGRVKTIEHNPIDTDPTNPMKDKPFWGWLQSNDGERLTLVDALTGYFGVNAKELKGQFEGTLDVYRATFQHYGWLKCRGYLENAEVTE